MQVGNLFAVASGATSADLSEEVFELLIDRPELRLERIVSRGQATPRGQWFDQPRDEWVVLLTGSAAICFEGETDEIGLRPGDYLYIAAHRRHRVAWTDAKQPTIWLALHFASHQP